MTASLSELDPRCHPLCEAFIAQGNAAIAPSHLVITVTYRAAALQDAAKAAGLSKAGAGQSPHNVVDASGNPAARGFDFAVIDPVHGYIRDGNDYRYSVLGQVLMQVGLKWGGLWTMATDGTGPDYDHAQMFDWRNLPPI